MTPTAMLKQRLTNAAIFQWYFMLRAVWIVLSSFLFLYFLPQTEDTAKFVVRHWVGIVFICPVYLAVASQHLLYRIGLKHAKD